MLTGQETHSCSARALRTGAHIAGLSVHAISARERGEQRRPHPRPCAYGRRTGPVRALSMAAGSGPHQTGCMNIEITVRQDAWCGPTLEDRSDRHNAQTFDQVVLPHLPAARSLARWLVRNEHDAEDLVQEASLRAFRYFGTFTGGNGRAWFLRIVRNTCIGWHQRFQAATDPFDETHHGHNGPIADPETLLLHTDAVLRIERAMSLLPHRSRELLRLRELEGLSYRELADAMGIPMGTVMSGLARARDAFRDALQSEAVAQS